MARRKNVKRIDPRYFMDEKTERLDEGVMDTMKRALGIGNKAKLRAEVTELIKKHRVIEMLTQLMRDVSAPDAKLPAALEDLQDLASQDSKTLRTQNQELIRQQQDALAEYAKMKGFAVEAADVVVRLLLSDPEYYDEILKTARGNLSGTQSDREKAQARAHF